MERQLLDGCLWLAAKGLFNGLENSFSMRIQGNMEMLLTSGNGDWRKIGIANLHTVSLSCKQGLGGLHAAIYRERDDVGAVAISSPRGVRLLARRGGVLPPAFDEYMRHTELIRAPKHENPDCNAALGETITFDIFHRIKRLFLNRDEGEPKRLMQSAQSSSS
jgi:hypothetical protein